MSRLCDLSRFHRDPCWWWAAAEPLWECRTHARIVCPGFFNHLWDTALGPPPPRRRCPPFLILTFFSSSLTSVILPRSARGVEARAHRERTEEAPDPLPHSQTPLRSSPHLPSNFSRILNIFPQRRRIGGYSIVTAFFQRPLEPSDIFVCFLLISEAPTRPGCVQ